MCTCSTCLFLAFVEHLRANFREICGLTLKSQQQKMAFFVLPRAVPAACIADGDYRINTDRGKDATIGNTISSHVEQL